MPMTAADPKKASPAKDMANRYTARMFAEVFARAYLEASDAVREVIESMSRIVADPEADADDRDAAMETLLEALFPTRSEDGLPGVDLEKIDSVEVEGYAQEQQASSSAQAAFVANLRRIMQARGLDQTRLAQLTGVGQPAISMMLNRASRPQRRTVAKFAEALGVAPQELWPET